VRAHVPHRAEYETELDTELTAAAFKPLEDSVDDIVPVKPLGGMKNRSKPGLDIDDPVLVHIRDHFVRHLSSASSVCMTPQVCSNPSR